ncbi:Protein SCAF11 [Armadillidium nasatum]|uniref:Protein SCAF11 n=1 Tax=Armadillidium nasatum TaxID=96803 RepID=A0A5N5TCM2_9CRUS|nr:Protein SCAF11 [Armadillidium nasatum]
MRKPREDSCPICCEKLTGKIGSPGQCNHFFCLDCISQWAKRRRTCPLDRKGFSSIQLFEKREGKMHKSDEDSIDLPENSIGSLNRLPLPLDLDRIDIDFSNASNVTQMLSSIDPEGRINPSMDLMDVRGIN